MTQKKDDAQIKKGFEILQSRQLVAIAVALLLVVSLTVVYKRQDLFGELSKNTIFALQLLVIAAFIGFSAFNWRCPSCKKYLGPDINRPICRKCGTRLR
jgi:TctA family transporter